MTSSTSNDTSSLRDERLSYRRLFFSYIIFLEPPIKIAADVTVIKGVPGGGLVFYLFVY